MLCVIYLLFMALTVVIIATFLLPALIFGMVLYWRKVLNKKVEKQDKEKGELINVMEEIIERKIR